jgi:antitoxin CcdA
MRMMASRSHRSDPAASPKRATNVSLSEALVAEAKEHGISVSRSCEAGLAAAVKQAREAKWIEENRAFFKYWNDWVEEHGLPLAEYRMF